MNPAEPDACANASLIFNDLSAKFSRLMYNRVKDDSSQIDQVLDEINNLDYRYPVITNPTKAVLLVNQCCTLIPPDDSRLVVKCCKLITNLVNRQHVPIEGQTLSLAVQWCLLVVKQATFSGMLDALIALETLLRNNLQNAHSLLPSIVNTLATLLESEKAPEVLLLVVQCLEACTLTVDDSKKDKKQGSPVQLDLCGNIFLKYLTEDKPEDFNDILHCKLLISCLCGRQNIIQQNNEFLIKDANLLMGISKTYMVYGIKGIEFMKPQEVMPSILNVAEPASNTPKEKKGGKIVKQRKHRTPNPGKNDKRHNDLEEWPNERAHQGYIPATATFDVNCGTTTSPSQAHLKTSDSDFSDTERGRAARLGIMQGRVRQAALSHLLHLLKLLDKHAVFSYWSGLIPDSPAIGTHNLATCILKDPSPKGRMAALNVLLVLVSSSKFYLAQAESSEKYSAFTPFSVILGITLQHLHKCLSLALNENSIPVLTQVLKCMAALVQATPYHKLKPGILTKIIRNAKTYAKHRDATVQVAALIVFGCILASEPLVPEAKEALLKQDKPQRNDATESHDNPPPNLNLNCLVVDDNDEIECIDFSSSDDEGDIQNFAVQNVPWLLEKCLNNLGVSIMDDKIIQSTTPTPVKLESLQVISAMTRNYFECLMEPHLGHIKKGLDLCFLDKYSDLRLHAGRTIDFVGQAINQHINALVVSNSLQTSFIQKGVNFWQTLLNNLLASLLQCNQLAALRAVGCDCLGSIGPRIFEQLPRDKQIVIITLLFGRSRDEENSVKAAAVRALAICVLYPSLREDPGFVVDVAETIHRTLQDDNMMVRIKASWSLGNLSDALALNRSDKNTEEVPESILLKLLQISTQASSDNDKIKVNTVRALGNLLQLITQDLIAQKPIKDCVSAAIGVLIKNATTGTNMKVRWNACYAIGSVLKNPVLLTTEDSKSALFETLMDLVVGFGNFKVRIHAAAALSCPVGRKLYGQHFNIVWDRLLRALENTRNVKDFSEYNHRDHLVDQICLALGHLTALLTTNDLQHIHKVTVFYLDSLKVEMQRVLERLIPEKSSTLLAAVTHLNNLMSDSSSEEKDCIKILLEVFNNDILL